ncbi:TadE/TadG family type IV pilus assembly protein [Ahrensia sp. R2A130]|uniref:TadE/TadG family type IV pilus assembly protein n=1 Tax=Ahrensia sp. R2A130 TaxID=744979 RepID=UPI0001E0E880|nr:TadE/TadG family type IV pilus assembly protein [Ahrensia sp. R2A130]EFL89856.1 putative TadE family protein [Ahrensia sp. R2A130]
MKNLLKRPSLLSSGFLRRFRKDERGISMVEFALISPALLSMYLGAIVATHMEHASTAVGKVTGTVADIIAQSPVVDRSIIDGAFAAGEAMMSQQYADDLEIVLTGVIVEPVPGDNSNNPQRRGRVAWTASHQRVSLAKPSRGQTYPLPDWATKRNGFYVVAKGRLKQTPLYGDYFNVGGDGKMTYNYENIFVPRSSLETECSNC